MTHIMQSNDARQLAIDSISQLIDSKYTRIVSTVVVNNKNTIDEGVFDELVDDLNKIGSID